MPCEMYNPDYAISPGATLKELIEDKRYRNLDLSGIPVEEILSARVPINNKIASDLERIFEVPESFWLNLERQYRATIKRLEDEGRVLYKEADGSVYVVY